MKRAIVLAMAAFATMAFASNFETAQENAKDYLEVETVTLDDESDKSYFFVTELEFKEDDIAEDYPCFRGVVVNKQSGQVVAPSTDPKIKITYAYSDTDIEGLVVINCAD